MKKLLSFLLLSLMTMSLYSMEDKRSAETVAHAERAERCCDSLEHIRTVCKLQQTAYAQYVTKDKFLTFSRNNQAPHVHYVIGNMVTQAEEKGKLDALHECFSFYYKKLPKDERQVMVTSEWDGVQRQADYTKSHGLSCFMSIFRENYRR